MVEINTLLALTAAIFFVGLLLALIRISTLKAEMTDLRSKGAPGVQQLGPVHVNASKMPLHGANKRTVQNH